MIPRLKTIYEKDIKRLLAHSSVAQIGYITLAFAIGTKASIAAGFIHMFNHAIIKGGLFIAITSLGFFIQKRVFGRIYLSNIWSNSLLFSLLSKLHKSNVVFLTNLDLLFWTFSIRLKCWPSAISRIIYLFVPLFVHGIDHKNPLYTVELWFTGDVG